MFFAETLGPILTETTAREIRAFLKRKLNGQKTVSPDHIREIVAEYMAIVNLRTSTDSVIDFLAREGVITFQGPTSSHAASFELAA